MCSLLMIVVFAIECIKEAHQTSLAIAFLEKKDLDDKSCDDHQKDRDYYIEHIMIISVQFLPVEEDRACCSEYKRPDAL